MSKSEEMLEILRKGAGLPEGAEIIKVDNDNRFPIIITYKIENDIVLTLNIRDIKKETAIYKTTRFGGQKWINCVYEDIPLSIALDEIKKITGLPSLDRYGFKYDKETGWNINGFQW